MSSAETTHGIFTGGIQRVLFPGAAKGNRREPINITCGERCNPALAISFAYQAGQTTVHGPGLRFLPGRPELHAGHKDNVGGIGESGERFRVQQVTAHRLYALCLQLRFQPGGGESGDADHPPRNSRDLRCSFRHAGQGRPHFPTHAQDDNVAIKGTKRIRGSLRGLAQKFIEFLDIADGGPLARSGRSLLLLHSHKPPSDDDENVGCDCTRSAPGFVFSVSDFSLRSRFLRR